VKLALNVVTVVQSWCLKFEYIGKLVRKFVSPSHCAQFHSYHMPTCHLNTQVVELNTQVVELNTQGAKLNMQRCGIKCTECGVNSGCGFKIQAICIFIHATCIFIHTTCISLWLIWQFSYYWPLPYYLQTYKDTHSAPFNLSHPHPRHSN
jgi:hypothetical protein